ncbi:MAG TPA: YfhO family protein, partial [Saprospiraceae bacterium]|nr:YfhO family protein [Saprospiraceae bacterium]
DKGWQAYVDGQPADHIRVNYVFRGMKIPSGNHTIEFKFIPVKVLRSIKLGFWLNNLAGLLLLGLCGWLFYSWYKTEASSPVAAPQAQPVVKPGKPGIKKGKKP